MLCLLGEIGKEGDGSSTTTNNDHLLSRVVEVLGPGLWVDPLALVLIHAWNFGLESLIIVVVSAAENDKLGGDYSGGVRLCVIPVDFPNPLLARPFRVTDSRVELNIWVDIELFCRLLDVLVNRLTVRDGLVRCPRLEGETEREHV